MIRIKYNLEMRVAGTENWNWIQTWGGERFPLDTFDSSAIRIEDIAHALSMLCRFNAQCTRFYSVAEHSVHVSYEIRADLALLGLMHDATEAYLGDVPGPLKKLDELAGFVRIEDDLAKVIADKFGFVLPADDSADHKELKAADLQLLVDEKAAVMADCAKPWPKDAPPIKNPGRIECWPFDLARDRFLARFAELTANAKVA